MTLTDFSADLSYNTIENLNILAPNSILDGPLADFDVVDQLVHHFAVKGYRVLILADEGCPLVNVCKLLFRFLCLTRKIVFPILTSL